MANADSTYTIIDEPRPGPIGHLVVSPIWPLFAIMFAGSWLSFPWFAFNSFSLNTSDKWKSLYIAIAAIVGSFLLTFLMVLFVGMEILPQDLIRYGMLIITVWKLSMAYYLYLMQDRSFQIFKEYEGTIRNGIIIVFLGAFLGRKYILSLSSSIFWIMTLS